MKCLEQVLYGFVQICCDFSVHTFSGFPSCIFAMVVGLWWSCLTQTFSSRTALCVSLSLSLSLLAHGDRGCLAQRQRNVHPHPFFASGLHSNETYNFIQSYKWASLDLDCGDSNFKIDAWAYCRSVLWLMRVARLESLDEGKQLSHRPIVCWVYDTLQHTTWNWVSGCVQNGL